MAGLEHQHISPGEWRAMFSDSYQAFGSTRGTTDVQKSNNPHRSTSSDRTCTGVWWTTL